MSVASLGPVVGRRNPPHLLRLSFCRHCPKEAWREKGGGMDVYHVRHADGNRGGREAG